MQKFKKGWHGTDITPINATEDAFWFYFFIIVYIIVLTIVSVHQLSCARNKQQTYKIYKSLARISAVIPNRAANQEISHNL